MSASPPPLADLPLFSGRRESEAPVRRPSTGAELKREAIERVESNNSDFVRAMRIVARQIAVEKGWVTASDLREWADAHDVAPRHPNAWGAIFSAGEWVKVGEEPSRTTSCHGHVNPRWQLRA